MVRRDWSSRWVAVGLTALLALSCGGSPSSPTPPPTLPAPPSPTPPVGGAGAVCPLGKGTVVTACSRGKTPTLLNEVNTAIDLLAQQNPKVLDVNDQAVPGSGQYRILDQKGFIEGVAANLRAAGLCAQPDYDHPLEVINVKSSQDVSEDFDLVLSSGYVRRGQGSYRQSCSPAAFPVDPDPSWPPSGSGCGKPYPPPISKFNSKIHLWGGDYVTLDSTAIVGPNREYCTLVGYTDGRDMCPVRVPNDPERIPCESWLVGKAKDTGRYGPTWTFNGEYCKGLAVNGCENHPEDQYGLLAAKGGLYVMCGQNGACGQVLVDR